MKLALSLAALMFLGLSQFSYASHGEFFGSSVFHSMIGNQANSDKHDPANNYYIPALLARSESITLSLSATSAKTNFEEINNVVIRNATNNATASPEQIGSVDTDYPAHLAGSIHMALPLAHPSAGAIGVSVFTPIETLAETNTGDPFLPEYVFYRARYRRTVVHLNYAHPWSETLSFSIGAHIGFQVAADLGTQASVANNNVGSSARAAASLKPSAALILSAAWELPELDALAYFTYQQESESKLESDVTGELNNPLAGLFDLDINSTIYFDPHILRAGFAKKFDSMDLELFASAEYQIWENYKSPIAIVTAQGGILEPSQNFEQLDVKNIFVPKLGITKGLTEEIKIHGGFSFRPTPLQGDFSGSGNSLDADSLILTGGLSYATTFFDQKVDLALGGQFHRLSEQEVNKTPGLENGNAGNKIGAGGFTIGGNVMVGTIGLKTQF